MSSLVYYFSCSHVFGGYVLAIWPTLFFLTHYSVIFFGTSYTDYTWLIKTSATIFLASSVFRSFSHGLFILSFIFGFFFCFSPSSWARTFLDFRPCPLPFLSFAYIHILFSSLIDFFSWSNEAWLPLFIH